MKPSPVSDRALTPLPVPGCRCQDVAAAGAEGLCLELPDLTELQQPQHRAQLSPSVPGKPGQGTAKLPSRQGRARGTERET